MSRLTEEEATALRLASIPNVPMERLELMHFLGYPERMPRGSDRVVAVVERILENRGFDPIGERS